jgi:hypothetical protein
MPWLMRAAQVVGRLQLAAPSVDPRQYVIVAHDFARLGSDTQILNGHVAVGQAFGTLTIGRDSWTASTTHVAGDTVKQLTGPRR